MFELNELAKVKKLFAEKQPGDLKKISSATKINAKSLSVYASKPAVLPSVRWITIYRLALYYDLATGSIDQEEFDKRIKEDSPNF